jgi:UDP-N-acetylmuramoylalanine--D-glutamate ligase
MNMNNFTDKKIGIWGFGVVGQSALTYFDQHQVASIEILDTKNITLPVTKNVATATMQTPESIDIFLQQNDLILASPGIKLHDYQNYAHKFIAELDLYQHHASWPTIAITGSLGKTSITHLLTSILQKMNINAIAAGNIGNAMLNLIAQKNQHHDIAVLELSSFQLQQAQTFAPDFAIITNLYENHLDHHKNMAEYCAAKCNIFIRQSNKQQALLPLELIDSIAEQTSLQKKWAFFSADKPTDQKFATYFYHAIYYLNDFKIYKKIGNQIDYLFDITILPAITFDANWLIIIAALDLQNINLTNLASIAQQLDIPDYRLAKIGSWNGSVFYNDSKSTVWQATLQAVLSIEKISKNPIKLFVGGLSKGADRTPLFVALAGKNIEVFAFGKESQQIEQLCQQSKITCHAYATLDAAWQACIQNLVMPSQILFSPGGSSFDLFADYKARGDYFMQLVHTFCKK